MENTDNAARMPGLVLPFAVVGAAAGWISVDFLDNPLLALTPSHAEGLAAVCAAVVGAIMGRWMERRCAPEMEWLETQGMWVQVAFATVAGGVAAGMVVGTLAFETLRGTGMGILGGLGAGVAFLPVCILVVSAARRAARARLGSVVADADRRELWAVTAAALSVTTLASVPNWLFYRTSFAPWLIAGTALGAAAALLACDLPARRALRRDAEASRTMEAPSGEAEAAGEAPPEIDFGLGDELRARVVRGAAYRGRERTEARALGSADLAVQAVNRAVLKKALAFAVASAVVAAHFLAPKLPESVLAHEIACNVGNRSECQAAALLIMLDDDAPPDLRDHAHALAARACFDPLGARPSTCRAYSILDSRTAK